MNFYLTSLKSPAPPGFSFEPTLDIPKIRRGVFCIYSDDSSRLKDTVYPLADKITGIIILPGPELKWRSLGPFCYEWAVPETSIPFLSQFIQPYLGLITEKRQLDDMVKSQSWDLQRAAQDRLFLSRVQVEFRDAMLRAEKELRGTQEYLNQIIEFLPYATFVIDQDKKIIAWNRAMERITGVPKNDMIGKGNYEYSIPFYGERRPILIDILYMDKNEVWEKYDYVKYDGNSIFVETFAPKVNNGKGAYLLGSAALLYGPGGKIIGAIESIRDVTRHHQVLNDLREAKLIAEDANKAKGIFLSNVSHEVRTPLNAIIGYAELIMREQNLDRVHNMANTVLHESDILLGLVNAILDQARIESGTIDVEYVNADITDIIDTSVKSVENQAKKKGLGLNVNISNDVPRFIRADRLRVCQVLINLLSNSIKFTEKGSVSIYVGLSGHEKNKVYIRFEVTDTGMGIPEEKKHLIFERFAQVDAAVTRKYRGAGLGLSLSKGLVDVMGGKIGFDSEAGKGSKFWFILPFLLSEKDKTPYSTGEVKTKETTPARKGRILLVEDYEPNQEVAKLHLESGGYDVDVAGDGIEALKVCEQKEYQLVLMDIQMPGMDGYETTRQLRSKRGWAENVIILGLTANADEKSCQECLSAGMDGVITKPIRRAVLLSEVARRLSVNK